MRTDFFGREIKGIASLNEWLNDKNRREGYTCLNYRFRRELDNIDHKLAKKAAVAFILLVGLGIENCRGIMRSAAKQRRFVWAVLDDVKRFRIEKGLEKMFSRQIRQINNRANYIDKIITENLRLSKYFPYFRATGFEQLQDFPLSVPEVNSSYFADVMGRIEEYNKTHSEEVAEYVESIRSEIEAKAAYRKRIDEQYKREKERKKAEKREADEEVKLIQANKEMHKKREACIDRSMNYLYRDAEAE